MTAYAPVCICGSSLPPGALNLFSNERPHPCLWTSPIQWSEPLIVWLQSNRNVSLDQWKHLNLQSQLLPEDWTHYRPDLTYSLTCHDYHGPFFTAAEVEQLCFKPEPIDTHTHTLSPHPPHRPDTCHRRPAVHQLSLSFHSEETVSVWKLDRINKFSSEYECSYLRSASARKKQHKVMTQETTKLPLFTSWVSLLLLRFLSECGLTVSPPLLIE